jgi:hypothetical protein
MQRTADGRLIIRPSRAMSTFLAIVGGACVVLAVGFPFAIGDESLYDLLIALLFVTLALLVAGILTLRQAWLRFKTRIVVDDTGLQLSIPTWAGRCASPMLEASVSWSEIERITCQEVGYGPLAMASVTVNEYTLHTPRGRYTLAKAFCPRLQELIETIAHRAKAPLERAATEHYLGWWRRPGA